MENTSEQHNPDGLTPEQVGEGWRLLRRDEPLLQSDQCYNSVLAHEWTPLGNMSPFEGKLLPLSDWTYRRRIEPAATEPTTEQIIASKDAEIARLKTQIEEIGDAATWLICDPATRLSDSGIKFLATIRNDSSNAYNDLRAEIATLRAELDAAKADSAMLDWLSARLTKYRRIDVRYWVHDGRRFNICGDTLLVHDFTSRHGETEPLRAAIADAMKGAQQ